MPNPLLANLPAPREFDTPPSTTWTSTEHTMGRAACWAILLLRGLQLSGVVCLFGLARVFAATPVTETSR